MTDVLELPWPPSVNHYWKHFRNRAIIGERGVMYRNLVWAAERSARMQKTEPQRLSFGADARLSVVLNCYPPDKRTRDIDNLPKAILDSLSKSLVWQDDSQIDMLTIARCDVCKPGRIVVSIALC